MTTSAELPTTTATFAALALGLPQVIVPDAVTTVTFPERLAAKGHAGAASNKLKAFMNEVQAQFGKKISPAQANQMLTAADRIRTVMGC